MRECDLFPENDDPCNRVNVERCRVPDTITTIIVEIAVARVRGSISEDHEAEHLQEVAGSQPGVADLLPSR